MRNIFDSEVARHIDTIIEVKEKLGHSRSKYSEELVLSVIAMTSQGDPEFETDKRAGLLGARFEQIDESTLVVDDIKNARTSIEFFMDWLDQHSDKHQYRTFETANVWMNGETGEHENMQTFREKLSFWSVWVDDYKNDADFGLHKELNQ